MESIDPAMEHFGLQGQPFSATADPAFMYATRGHKECLYRLWNSIDGRHGIAVVIGNYGTGKTTLLRKVLVGMKADPEKYNTAVVASPIPSWTSFALLEKIIAQFGLRTDKDSFMGYMDVLNNYLVANRHRVNTLIIDDAQNLNKRGQLELLRLAQNLETPQHKLLNLVCFAQLEWMQVLQAVPQFEQRINMTFNLGPLDMEETQRLIAYRLRQAGAVTAEGPIFSDGAVEVIQAYSEGSPRVIVTLCRNALIMAAQLGQKSISQNLMVHTIEKTTLPDRDRRARIAAFIRGRRPGGGPSESPFTAPPDEGGGSSPAPRAGAPRTAGSREQRAADILLRSSRRPQ